MLKRRDKLPGYAIGGLSGGEEKSIFWRMYVTHRQLHGEISLKTPSHVHRVLQCADRLPPEKPRYCM